MPSSFLKKCLCHGKPFPVLKKSWNKMRRYRQEPYCLEGLLQSKAVVFPYIPLVEPRSPRRR